MIIGWMALVGCLDEAPQDTGADTASATTTSTPPVNDIAACEACADFMNVWCGATQTCGPEDRTDCPYGLATYDTECNEPQRFVQTELPVDCRVPANDELPECTRIQDLSPGSVGQGVNLDGYDLGGGFVDGDRLVLAFACTLCTVPQSGVLAVDLASGDRTLLSGRIDDPFTGLVEVGSGEFPSSLDDVQLAPDGGWIALDSDVYGAEIYRIDPATGDREVVVPQGRLDGYDDPICRLDGYGLHVAWDVPITPQAGVANLVVQDDGTIWLRGRLPGWYSEPLGVEALVAIRGDRCDVVSASSYDRPLDLGVGDGPRLWSYLPWLVFDGARVISPMDPQTVIAVDPATGARSILSSADDDAWLGDGPEVGDDFALLAGDGTLWTTGPYTGASLVQVDLGSSDRVAHEILAGPFTFADQGPFVEHPTLPGVFLVAWEGVTAVEPATGNSVVLSR